MNGVTTAFWSMTINNPDETTMALLRQGYPDYMRELIYTQEEGKEGTPHIQAWLKLQRQQRLSFVKKLFPRGHFRAITTAEYDLNTKQYAQKKDETTRSASVHKFNDPMHTVEGVVRRVARYIFYEVAPAIGRKGSYEPERLEFYRRAAERMLVRDDYKLAKVFVSATYKQMWKLFGDDMLQNVIDNDTEEVSRVEVPVTHTHTHTQAEKIISPEVYTSDADRREDEEGRSEGQDSTESPPEDGEGDDNGSGETDEDYAEGFGDGFSETDSCSWS